MGGVDRRSSESGANEQASCPPGPGCGPGFGRGEKNKQGDLTQSHAGARGAWLSSWDRAPTALPWLSSSLRRGCRNVDGLKISGCQCGLVEALRWMRSPPLEVFRGAGVEGGRHPAHASKS